MTAGAVPAGTVPAGTAPRPPASPAAAARERPLRRDAARNRERILRAAAAVFTERGLDATLDDVARQAGVGVGTVYRHFPGKEALVEALFTARIDEMVTAVRGACDSPDPWSGLVACLEHATAAIAGDTGLRQLMMFAAYGTGRVACAREQVRPVIAAAIARAQQAGELRRDFSPSDVPMIAFMLASVADYAGPIAPALWRRYLALIIDALRPARDGTTALPAAPLTPGELAQAMRARGRQAACPGHHGTG
jgi:AcrR family transcriptional regulator